MRRGRSRRPDEVDVVTWLRSKGEIERAEWLRWTGLCSPDPHGAVRDRAREGRRS